MKVAFATDNAEHVNTHFGHCEAFTVYEITPEKYEKLAPRHVNVGIAEEESGRIEARVNAVMDCTLLFITQIGPAAAARVTRNNIMPVKVEAGTSITEQLDRLLFMLQTKPPLWLVKALNQNQLKGEIHEG